jgi:predicted dithiol-disulfide oxidoreductase (DUF899 family)
MCTSLMSSWEEKIPDIEQRVDFATMARSPIDRLVATKRVAGPSSKYIRIATAITPVSAEDADAPAYNVFMRKGGKMRHFWGDRLVSKASILMRPTSSLDVLH